MDQIVSTYQRLTRSATAEQVLSKAKIFIDTNVLRPHLIGDDVDKSSEIYKFMKNASQGGGFISTEYDSKLKITARMFTKKNHLNLITLHDNRVLKSMRSRYDGGFMMMIDYSNFEPSIIKSILGLSYSSDLHQEMADILGTDRNVAKRFNMELIYATNFNYSIERVVGELSSVGLGREEILTYVDHMVSIREFTNAYIEPMMEMYSTNGYVANSYGRKIYPKNERNVFNNIIQSIGSEILVEAIIKLDTLLQGTQAHILFHRFDALYFDISKPALFQNLPRIIKAMESIDDSIDLKVDINIGGDLTSLKELQLG